MEGDGIEVFKELFSSFWFQKESEANRKVVINNYNKKYRLSDDEIMKLYNEQLERTTAIFNSFSNDPLFLLLAKSKPKDVLRLCQVTPKLRKVCNNPQTFINLLKLHYTRFNPFNTENPKEQYLAITNRIKTWFELTATEIINEDGDTVIKYSNPKQIGKSLRQEEVPGFNIARFFYQNPKIFNTKTFKEHLIKHKIKLKPGDIQRVTIIEEGRQILYILPHPVNSEDIPISIITASIEELISSNVDVMFGASPYSSIFKFENNHQLIRFDIPGLYPGKDTEGWLIVIRDFFKGKPYYSIIDCGQSRDIAGKILANDVFRSQSRKLWREYNREEYLKYNNINKYPDLYSKRNIILKQLLQDKKYLELAANVGIPLPFSVENFEEYFKTHNMLNIEGIDPIQYFIVKVTF